MKNKTIKNQIIIILIIVAFMLSISNAVFALPVNPISFDNSIGNNQITGVGTLSVTFNTNGGSTVAIQNVQSGAKATRPATNPTREGFTFDDWYADSTFTTKFDFDKVITANTTVYAKWISTPTVDAGTKTNTVTKDADSKLPQTGDAEDYIIFALIGVCAVASVVAFVKSKKYRV